MPSINNRPIPELDYRTLTDVVNLTQSPTSWLANTFFPTSRPQTTDRIDLEIVRQGREMAPLIARGSEAVLVGGVTRSRQSVGGAHIRIKRQFNASKLLFQNHVGGPIYRSGETQGQLTRRHIAEDLAYASQQIDDRIEWLCAQAIRGRIAYNELNGESILIDADRPSSLNLDFPGNHWDTAGPANADITGVERTVRLNMSALDTFQPNVAIMGTEAAEAFRQAFRAQKLFNQAENIGLIQNRQLFAEGDISPHAAKLVGLIDGVQYWEYPRQIMNDAGVMEPLIRPKYIEYLATGPLTRRVVYYGAIEDAQIFAGAPFVSERFSKSWTQEDPSAIMYLIESNPLPWCEITTAQASAKVISG